MNGTTVAQTLRAAQLRLSSLSDNARLDAELLLAHVLGRSRTWLHTWPEKPLGEAAQKRFRELLERRIRGVPIAYLTGRCEFWSLPLEVNPATLIPRPETELLVEQALKRIPQAETRDVADLGTGSGAIALAVARERPRCRMVATDRSEEALATARRNAATLGIEGISFRHGDWYEALQGERFDLILSNPPYVAEDDPHLQQGDLRFEPRTALAAGGDGLDAIRLLVRGGCHHLRPGGWLLLEHGFDQGAAVRELMQRSGYREIACHTDLAGLERVTAGRLPV